MSAEVSEMAVVEAALKDSLEAVAPNPADTEMARDLARRLALLLGLDKTTAKDTPQVFLSFRGSDKNLNDETGAVSEASLGEVALPLGAVHLLARLLAEMGEGHAVTLLSLDEEVSTQRAAELLNVSRPYVVRLLDEGQIPARKVGTHRRALLRDVLEFKQRDDEKRLQAMEELQALSQEMGLY